MSATLSPNTSSSLDNKNLNIVPYKLNLFTNLDNANENLLTNKSVQRCRALSIMTRDEMLSGADLRGRSERWQFADLQGLSAYCRVTVRTCIRYQKLGSAEAPPPWDEGMDDPRNTPHTGVSTGFHVEFGRSRSNIRIEIPKVWEHSDAAPWGLGFRWGFGEGLGEGSG